MLSWRKNCTEFKELIHTGILVTKATTAHDVKQTRDTEAEPATCTNSELAKKLDRQLLPLIIHFATNRTSDNIF